MKKYEKLILSQYFNNKAIIEKKEFVKNSNLKNLGLDIDNVENESICFFKLDSFPNSKEDFFLKGIPFALPNININQYDNLFCNNQEIEVIKDIYKKIHFLGFCVLSSFTDEFKILYENSLIEKVDVTFDNWYYAGLLEQNCDKFKFDSIIFEEQFSGDLAIKSKSLDDVDTGIYYFEVNVSSKSRLEKIILPQNIYMHIIAITLEK